MKLKHAFWSWVFRRMGWSIVNAGHLQSVDKSMIAVAPHTSWRDLLIGIITRNVIQVHVRFIAKHTLFVFPLGILMRGLGGSPVNRNVRSNLVDQVVRLYENHDNYHLCITPEGTRERVSRFRSGFYHIAKQAGVPIVLAAFDYENKVVAFSDLYWPGENKAADFELFYAFFDGIKGYHPEKSFYKN